MTSRGTGRAPTRFAYVAVVACLLVGVPMLAPSGPSHTPGSILRLGSAFLHTGASLVTWDNGLIRLAFTNPLPSFYVVSDQESRIASSHSLVRIAELTGTGNVSAYAPLRASNVSWSLSALPRADGSQIWLNASVPVVGSRGVWGFGGELRVNSTVWGMARVSFSFFLNASSAPDATSVEFNVGVTHWPWSDLRDVLGLEIGTLAVASTTLAPGPSTNSLLEIANGSKETVAQLDWAAQASVAYGNGTASNSSVGTYRVVSSDGSTSTVRLQFAAPRGGYSDLEYDPSVQLNLAAFKPHALPVWSYTQASLLAIAATAGLVGVLAYVAFRSRSDRAPSP